MGPTTIVKRDGRKRKFSATKVYEGIIKSMQDISMEDEELAQKITGVVLEGLGDKDVVPAEKVYELVLQAIISNEAYDLAKSYIQFREERTETREVKSGLMKAISQIAKETTRDNANIGNSPSAKMLQVGSEASKWYNLSQMPKHLAKLHKQGWMHIHDLDYYEKTINCLQIDLGNLLLNGFDAGRGYIRPPKRIGSAAALAAIILQSNQNDMYGGQSFDKFDTYMAPYVPRDYVKAIELSREGVATATARVKQIRDEVFQAMEGLVYNLNSMHSRAGAQVPFSSINFGCDTTTEGRLVTEMLLKAYEAGLGRGETPLFPNLVFRTKKGINLDQEDPNYDLFKLACRVASRRMNPTFSFMDASFNLPYGIQASYMGCRTRVMANVNGPAVVASRGNIGFVTMNLVRCAIESRGSWDKFYKNLDKLLVNCEEQLLHRYETVSKLKVRDLPFLMGQQLYLDSEKLEPDDTIEESIKHGTLSVGYIGIAEVMKLMEGKHHGEDPQVHKKALFLAEYIAVKVKEMSVRHHLNFTTLATPAEGLSGRFTALDREKYGEIPWVTDKGFYTNSFHIPVDYPIGMFEKLKLEGPFHKFADAGHISYVELTGAPTNNPEAVETLVKSAQSQDMGYMGINFPIDCCDGCGYEGIIDDACPKCGSISIKRIRRITGYLSTEDRFGDGKKAELSRRVKHDGK